MFGRKLTAQELLDAGLYNYVWDKTGDEFQSEVIKFLEGQLEVNDGKSMMETKRLQNVGIRDQRMIAVVNAIDALAERFVEDAPVKRFAEKKKLMEEKSKTRSKI
jgi:peroxisomal 3,2-trans-enoyl-CoA isomerase